jgi:tRNA-dihydrouridine synthase B
MTRIGHLTLDRPFCQAGLAGYSDRAMRVVARRRGCPYAVTEAIADTLLTNGGTGLRKAIDVNDEDHPVAGQIIGSEAATMSGAARILEDAGYDVVDVNLACPVKMMPLPRGGLLLRDVSRARAILAAVRAAVRPGTTVTVSLRRGFDEGAESAERFEAIVETAWAVGYDAVRIHARTVQQRYLGPSRWDFLKKAKALWPGRTILGSGDVFEPYDAVRMLRETGVDVVWIARGAIGNPWIFEDAARLLRGEDIAPPTVHAQRDALIEHLDLSSAIHSPELAGRRTRKMGIKTSRFHPRAAEVKRAFIEAASLDDCQAVLARDYATDEAGVWPPAQAADETSATSAA